MARSNLWIKNSVSKIERRRRALMSFLRNLDKKQMRKVFIASPLIQGFSGLRMSPLEVGPLLTRPTIDKLTTPLCKTGVMALALFRRHMIHVLSLLRDAGLDVLHSEVRGVHCQGMIVRCA